MRVARFWMWFIGILGLCLVGLLVWDAIDILSGRFSVIGFLGIFLMVLVVPFTYLFSLVWFKVRSGDRYAAVARLNPDAYLVQLVATAGFVGEARKITTELGLTRPTLRSNSYATLAASTDLLRVYSGGAKPSLRLTIPTSAIVYARAGTYSNGFRTVPTIDLGFLAPGSLGAAGANEPLPLQLIPLIQPGVRPKPMEAQFLPAELRRMQQATHPETVAPG